LQGSINGAPGLPKNLSRRLLLPHTLKQRSQPIKQRQLHSCGCLASPKAWSELMHGIGQGL
jgi:hypothetical protein